MSAVPPFLRDVDPLGHSHSRTVRELSFDAPNRQTRCVDGTGSARPSPRKRCSTCGPPHCRPGWRDLIGNSALTELETAPSRSEAADGRLRLAYHQHTTGRLLRLTGLVRRFPRSATRVSASLETASVKTLFYVVRLDSTSAWGRGRGVGSFRTGCGRSRSCAPPTRRRRPHRRHPRCARHRGLPLVVEISAANVHNSEGLKPMGDGSEANTSASVLRARASKPADDWGVAGG